MLNGIKIRNHYDITVVFTVYILIKSTETDLD
nr:MAG TPA: hypothetical protein [Caudoviricetes sp.]